MSFEHDPPKQGAIIVRDATTDDIEGIRAVQKEAWLVTYPSEQHGITREDIMMRDWASSERAERWRKSIESDPDQHVWVAEESEKILGFCVGKKGEQSNRLQAIYILPETQRKGIGSRLAEHCFDWLGSEKDIVVDVASYNDQAIGFYRKLGFGGGDPVPNEEAATLKSGKKIPEIRMRKAKRGDSRF